MLLALAVVGRLQGGNLPGSDAGVPRATSTTVADATLVASGLAVTGWAALPGLAVTGGAALPGQPAAVAVGEGAIWVLLEEGTLLRVDRDRHQVTGRLELGAPTGGMPRHPLDVRVGPLAVGAGAVWVGTRRGTVTARIDPVRLRVTARPSARASCGWPLRRPSSLTWSRSSQRCTLDPGSTSAGVSARLQVHYRAGQGARDTTDGLDSRHNQSAQGVDAPGLGADDDVIGPSQWLGLLYAVDLYGCTGNLPSLADLGLNEDIGGDHRARPPKLVRTWSG
jgi:hypothetical protein